jgi:hypothetical protein
MEGHASDMAIPFQLISKKYPVKFEYSNNAVNIGGTRVSMVNQGRKSA